MASETLINMTRTFTQADFDNFARLTGDNNPIHVDPAFAARTKFRRPVAHGMLLYGAICGLLSRHFPGAVQIDQSLMFPAPTFAGERMTISVEINARLPEERVRLLTQICDEAGQITCRGETTLQLRGGSAPGIKP